jgi:transcriptional regulator with XRE-family HTH domain
MSVANDKKTVLEIANKIKEARVSKNLTQEDVAKKAGLNTNSYAKIERGVQKPSTLTLTKILKALEIKSSKILSI